LEVLPTNNRTVLFVLVMTLIAAAVQSVYYYPKLPDQFPSHVTVSGEVDNYTAKSQLFVLMLSTIFGTAVFLTLGTLLALKKAPQLVNLPNKEYWFTPEHKQNTIAFVFKNMVKLTIASILMMIVILQSIIWVSLGSLQSPGMFIGSATGLLCAYCLIIIIQLNRRFRLPVAEQETPT